MLDTFKTLTYAVSNGPASRHEILHIRRYAARRGRRNLRGSRRVANHCWPRVLPRRVHSNKGDLLVFLPFMAYLMLPGSFILLPVVLVKYPRFVPTVFHTDSMKVDGAAGTQRSSLVPCLTAPYHPRPYSGGIQDAAAGKPQLRINIANLLIAEATPAVVAPIGGVMSKEQWEQLVMAVRRADEGLHARATPLDTPSCGDQSDCACAFQSRDGLLTYEEVAPAAVRLGETVWSPTQMSPQTARLCTYFFGVPSFFFPRWKLIDHLDFIKDDDEVGGGEVHMNAAMR